jgi:WD40 repeat protein
MSGKLIASFDHQDGVYQAAFSPDGTRLLTASGDKTAKLWDVASGKMIASFAQEDSVEHLTFSPNGASILTASADRTAKLWDTNSGKLYATTADKVDAVKIPPFFLFIGKG